MKKLALLSLSALLITASFFPWTAGFPVFLFMVPAVFVAIGEEKWKRRLLWGCVWGILIFLMNFYWTVVTIHHFGRMPFWLAGLLVVPLMLYQMLPFILWVTVTPVLYRRHILLPALLFPLLTYALPMIFPYTLSSTLASCPVLIQTASLWGGWGLDVCIIMVNLLLYRAWDEKYPFGLIAPAALVSLLVIYGGVLLIMNPKKVSPRSDRSLSCVILQPCVRDDDSEAVKEKKFFSAVAGARETAQDALVIIPESSLPDRIVERPDFMSVMKEIRHSLNAKALLFNGVVFQNGRLTNSEFLLAADGSLSRYDKNHLMWFGERFPLYSLFRKLPIYAASFANFDPGTGAESLTGADIVIATPICLEGIYPGYTARLARHADLIVNSTDDEWFGPTRATMLHFAQVRMRSIENRSTLLRAANTGYTAVVDSLGRVVRDLPVGIPDSLAITVPLVHRSTVYERIYPTIPAFFLLLFGVYWWRGGKR